jgi:hypothetical protein
MRILIAVEFDKMAQSGSKLSLLSFKLSPIFDKKILTILSYFTTYHKDGQDWLYWEFPINFEIGSVDLTIGCTTDWKVRLD